MSGQRQRLVIGMGDSGMSIAAYWYRDCDLTVVDDRHQPPHIEQLMRQLPSAHIHANENFRNWRAADYAQYESVAVSPGVDIKTLAAPADKLTNDMACFSQAWRRYAPENSRLVAVTGTNGKSTVAALAAHLINCGGKTAQAVGNIGEPVLKAFLRWRQSDFPQVAVVELSSFHLELAAEFYSDAAVVLNIGDDHLDRHGDLAHYAGIKRRIYNNSRRIIKNADLSEYNDLTPAVTYSGGNDADWMVKDGWIYRGDTAYCEISRLSASCQNYLDLVLATLALTDFLQLSREGVQAGLASFAGLAHRRRQIARYKEVCYIDDSKATNVAAASFALARSPGKIVWLGGGDGKGQDFSPLAAYAAAMRVAILLGKDAPGIESVLAAAGVRCVQAADMKAAVAQAYAAAQAGDTVLLSPACSSLDMFVNYQERGLQFARAVRQLTGEKP